MEKKKRNKIKNPWCVFCGDPLWMFGKIILEFNGILFIVTSTKDLLPQVWSSEIFRFERFTSFKEAVTSFCDKIKKEYDQIILFAGERFPDESVVKQIF